LASADELFREAQHALQNVSPGSTDERRNIARAKNYAMQVVRKYPHTAEAAQARAILAQLDVSIAAPVEPLAIRRPGALAPRDERRPPPRFKAAVADQQWRRILQRFVALPSNKKKLLAGGLLLVMFIPFAVFVLLGVAVVYALNLPLLQRHLLALLNSLES
jgi:hypothetical protein